MYTSARLLRLAPLAAVIVCVSGASVALTGCDRTESKTKTTSTKVTDEGNAVKKTTETTEKKVETSP
jgi:hypothetical protein